MLPSVHPCWGELWSFPDELFVIGYLVVSCSLVLNDRVFYSNCKLLQYNLNFFECYYFVKIYFHMVYFDFRLLLNTDTKLNKQSRAMFQGWSRRNNPQAKVLSTVPRAAWHQGVVTHTVSLGNQATS